jgi:hypothetical protein
MLSPNIVGRSTMKRVYDHTDRSIRLHSSMKEEVVDNITMTKEKRMNKMRSKIGDLSVLKSVSL